MLCFGYVHDRSLLEYILVRIPWYGRGSASGNAQLPYASRSLFEIHSRNCLNYVAKVVDSRAVVHSAARRKVMRNICNRALRRPDRAQPACLLSESIALTRSPFSPSTCISKPCSLRNRSNNCLPGVYGKLGNRVWRKCVPHFDDSSRPLTRPCDRIDL